MFLSTNGACGRGTDCDAPIALVGIRCGSCDSCGSRMHTEAEVPRNAWRQEDEGSANVRTNGGDGLLQLCRMKAI